MTRRRFVASAVLAAAVIAAGGAAAAGPSGLDPSDPSDPASGAPAGGDPDEPRGAEPRLIAPVRKPAAVKLLEYTHQGQLTVSVRLALGLRAIATYEQQDYCGAQDASATFGFAPVCTGRAPFSLDFEVGYGVARRIDAFVELRVGIEGDFGTSPSSTEGPRTFHVSPGARFFFSDSGRSKLFTTAQLVFDATGYEDRAGASRGVDFGVRNMSGLWFDLDRAYGFYAFIGETATFSRWLRFELEGGVGIQGRFL